MKQFNPQEEGAMKVLLVLIDIAQRQAGLAQTENCLYWKRQIEEAIDLPEEKQKGPMKSVN